LQRIALKKLHKKVYTDGYLGYLVWSRDETHIAYVAEQKTIKAKSFFFDEEQVVGGDGGVEKKNDVDVDNNIGGEHNFVEDWGETFVGVVTGRVFVVELEKGVVTCVGGTKDLIDVAHGQVCWIGFMIIIYF
jgi:hypothetical protein